ncbi:MAG: FtsQ-type POTRA domain-containing protein [Chloroflexi bacterium]|nr:FtsQ-type POTRA domain-containing protein [Chloroflexota bacterium]
MDQPPSYLRLRLLPQRVTRPERVEMRRGHKPTRRSSQRASPAPRQSRGPTRESSPNRAGQFARRLWTIDVLGKLFALTALLFSVWSIRTLVSSVDFEATSVLVSGNDLVPAEEIAGALGLGRSNVFNIQPRRLTNLLDAHPVIQSANVRPSLTGVIFVAVTERTPVVIWKAAGREVLVDSTGVTLREGTRDLPVVHAIGDSPAGEGGRVDPSAVEIGERVGPMLEALGLLGGQLQYQPGAGMSILGPQHRVILGSSDHLNAKLQAYRTIRRYLDDTRTPAEIVDVRSLDRPYFH